MPRVSLKRLLRGSSKRAVEDLLALADGPVRLEDETGKAVLGDPAAEGDRRPILLAGAALGAVIGAGAERVSRVLGHLAEREEEKLGLAEETLGRYKELTLIYDTSDKLSRVLDVDEVCRLIVADSRSFLRASGASIMLLDRRRNVLESIACSDPNARTRTLAATVGVEGRVLRTGRAEFVEDVSTTDAASEAGVCALMVAPLRSGEDVFGILRLTNGQRTAWTAGDLKLVTSLAGNAASAISHAMLHRERLRQQALRHQIERFASPWVLDAAFGERAVPAGRPVAALFCDVGDLTRWVDPGLEPEELMNIVRRATTAALGALMHEGATVQLSHAEMIVGLFASDGGLDPAAQAAVRAATKIVRALDRRFGGFLERSPGVAITHAVLPEKDATAAFFAAVGAAATLQGNAEGRLLVDPRIAGALGGNLRSLTELPGDHFGVGGTVYEVRA